jgi:hypothetical protein
MYLVSLNAILEKVFGEIELHVPTHVFQVN